MKILRSLALLIGITLLTALPIAAQQAPTYSAFYVFGDSLADNGNDYIATALDLPPVPEETPTVPPPQTYYCGRFSNGPVAFEQLWSRLQPKGAPLLPVLGVSSADPPDAVNFAFGGSGTGTFTLTPGGFQVPGLLTQVNMFSATVERAPDGALFAMLSGANDYLVQPPATPASPVVTVRNIGLAIEHLYRHGARTIIVVALPDLGRVPLVPQQQKLQMSVLSAVHNILLAGAVQALRAQHRDLSVVLVDPNRVINQLPPRVDRQTPMLDELVAPGASRCLLGNPDACPPVFDPNTCPEVPKLPHADRYLFWDAQHPTSYVHQRLADYIYSLLSK